MRLDLQAIDGMTLKIDSSPPTGGEYPTAGMQKGLILLHDGRELCEEGVGFGVPILKRGLQTIFPGAVELIPLDGGVVSELRARFTLNLEERISHNGTGTLNNPVVYSGKNFSAALIRRVPFLRGILTRTSSLLRDSLDWQTTYEPSGFSTTLTLGYSLDPLAGTLRTWLKGIDPLTEDISEVVLMFEQGARIFDEYRDSSGIVERGAGIGIWDLVRSREAAFISHSHGVSFSLQQVNGARLFRGHEYIGDRLAWSGFGYSLPPSLENFSCILKLKSTR